MSQTLDAEIAAAEARRCAAMVANDPAALADALDDADCRVTPMHRAISINTLCQSRAATPIGGLLVAAGVSGE